MATVNLAGRVAPFVVTALMSLTPAALSAPGNGSVMTHEPLAEGGGSMAVGGGLALAVPFLSIDGVYGLGNGFDVGGRYESVLGLIHFPELAARYNTRVSRSWKIGARLGLTWSLFALENENLNLTSTLYLTPEVGATASVTDETELVMAVGAEYDLVEFRVVDDDGEASGTFRYDATTFRFGMRTTFSGDLDAFVIGRVRLPIETLQYEATTFAAIPFVQAGATWSW